MVRGSERRMWSSRADRPGLDLCGRTDLGTAALFAWHEQEGVGWESGMILEIARVRSIISDPRPESRSYSEKRPNLGYQQCGTGIGPMGEDYMTISRRKMDTRNLKAHCRQPSARTCGLKCALRNPLCTYRISVGDAVLL
jgi:hypothetical protein